MGPKVLQLPEAGTLGTGYLIRNSNRGFRVGLAAGTGARQAQDVYSSN